MATNPAATLATASGIARRVQGDVQQLDPKKNIKLTKRVKYDTKNQVGAEYVEPVWLTGEHGATFAGNSGGEVDLNGAEVAESKNALLNPSSLYFQSRAVIDLLSRAVSMGERAAESYVSALMRNTKRGIEKRVEIKNTYGTLPIGTLSSATDLSTSSVFTLTAATWAPHIWLGMRNCPIDAYNGATQLNTNADLVITKVDPKNHQLTVSGNATDIDAVMAVGTNGSGTTLYLKSQYGNTGTGLKGIAKLASGDTYLGISCTTYNDVWSATQVTWDVSSTADFTWQDLQNGVEEAAGRGLENDLVVQVPFNVWTRLNSSLDALRAFDSSYKVSSVDMGHAEDAITYNSLGIKLKIEPSGFIMGGDIICYPDSPDFRRIGSSDVTFNVPGQGDDMFMRVIGTNTCEWMAFTNQDPWSTAPRDFIYFGA